MSRCNPSGYCEEAANGQMSMSKGVETWNKEWGIGATANRAKGTCREVATRPQRTLQGLITEACVPYPGI